MPCLPVMAELCQVTQSISAENQPELVKEPANLLSGKLSKDRISRAGKESLAGTQICLLMQLVPLGFWV